MLTYDWTHYRELFDHPDAQRALTVIRSLAQKLGVKWYLVGGAAVFLHVHNPPEDEPDIDILLDESLERAEKFVRALLARPGFRSVLSDSTERDMFATVEYRGRVKIDLFTSHEQPRGLAPTIRDGLPLEPIEYLVIEKLIRPRWEDILMVVDIFIRAKPNLPLLHKLAKQHGPEVVRRLLDARKLFIMSKRVGADRIRREAKMLAKRYELDII